jgi:hypothetical protein
MLVLKRLITFIATGLPVMIAGVALAASGEPGGRWVCKRVPPR